MSISVASFTDAWIETDNAIKMSGLEVSHLLQMRGLKLPYWQAALIVFLVASFTDAWIETWNKQKDLP